MEAKLARVEDVAGKEFDFVVVGTQSLHANHTSSHCIMQVAA